jgi:hypothetical protein
MSLTTNNPFGYLLSSLNEQPILTGKTSVYLTSAGTLTSLGVSVEQLGTATFTSSGGTPVANFPITGGTRDLLNGGEVITHQGSGLELKDSTGSVGLTDFTVDTQNGVIDANVTLDGELAGNLPVFDLGPGVFGPTLTLTSAAAGAVDQTLGTSAITSSTAIGTAIVSPLINPYSIGTPSLQFISPTPPPPLGETAPIVGGDTAVTLGSASTLAELGVAVKTLGFASLDLSGLLPVANFPITGGSENAAGDLILHQGSGLALGNLVGMVSLSDFFIDTQNDVVDANVSLNGKSAGNLAVFNLGTNGALTLTAGAAAAVDKTLGLGTAITSMTPIGNATPGVIAGPPTFDAGLGHNA